MVKIDILHNYFKLFKAKLRFSKASPQKCKLLLQGYERCLKIRLITVLAYFAVSLFLLPCSVYCEQIKLSVGLTVSPYVIKPQHPDQKISGFEVDIVREALGLKGYEIKFILQPLKRTKISFEEKQVDGVLTIQKHYPQIKGAFLSDTYITYHNFAVTLAGENMNINSINDLAGKKIIAFQQAQFALGKEFQAMANQNPNYREMASQDSQIGMFFYKRTEVIILDDRIFKYYKMKLKNIPTQQTVRFHDLFEATPYKIAFQKQDVRDAFNQGLKHIRSSGRYNTIITSYLEDPPHVEKLNSVDGN